MRSGPPLPAKTLFGFVLAVTAVAVIALLSYQSLQSTAASSKSLTQTVEVLAQLNNLLSTLKDAETGQRGYLLTGNENYLEPYLTAKAALPGEFATLRGLMANRPQQKSRIDALESVAKQKMEELGQTVDCSKPESPTQRSPSFAPTAARSTWIAFARRSAKWTPRNGSLLLNVERSGAMPRRFLWWSPWVDPEFCWFSSHLPRSSHPGIFASGRSNPGFASAR